MTNLRNFAPKTKLTEKEELEKEAIEENDFYYLSEDDQDEDDNIWEGGIFI
jgi:hypothetical protein